MQRRTWLKLGAVSATVLILAGGTVALLQPGLQQGRLSPGAQEVFASVGRAILDGTLPKEPAANQAALAGLLQRIDALAQALPPHAQAELSQLLGILGTGVGRRTLAGLSSDWRSAGVVEVQQALQSMRSSRLGLRLQSYQALHEIVGAAYFSDASTWPALGYPGPLKI
ncbi:MAG: hypothetical protein KJ614_16350 [Gammaproteobacteria bacterium]|uniref:hypothetical protein n=1 Tax=Rhodoferax sp. TaxID=50421 RepID=UPI0017C6734F|nr:hypothetical protein [Rhodoferax sp.]MBU3900465.1 hypothetical protein [Gammaproteobacteria bacterium]MBA3059932.1 hypothetical protein [Rhodoferax sp.]MBU3997131.1 hypothetical protein [Gammaproteobacteria bacterium]MBU4079910.1 hypothetical protein [Gammaproteobacteria bacterium]MBU4112925.1 hypothetical protein [Gammaproteobacteria bacterium]